jgi:hypothetical protein
VRHVSVAEARALVERAMSLSSGHDVAKLLIEAVSEMVPVDLVQYAREITHASAYSSTP